MRKDEIVITGLGVISPFGIGCDIFWESIVEGKSAIKRIKKFTTDKYVSKLSTEIENFNHSLIIKDPKVSRTSLFMQLAMCSAELALQDAALKINKQNAKRVGIFFATDHVNIANTQKMYDSLLEKGPGAVDPLLFAETVFNAPASMISIRHGIKGPIMAIPSGYISGSYAIEQALVYLEKGTIDYALVGAVEENSEILHQAYSDLKFISPLAGKTEFKEEQSCPFDARRNGAISGEGAIFFVLEKESFAKDRGAKAHGRIKNISTCNETMSVTSNDISGKGLEKSIRKVLSDLEDTKIDCVLSCAVSHPLIDEAETNALKNVFSEEVYNIPITNIKANMGFTYSCDVFFNMAAAVFIMQNNVMPPILNYEVKDVKCDLDYVSGTVRHHEINNILVNSFNWGGTYSSLIMSSTK